MVCSGFCWMRASGFLPGGYSHSGLCASSSTHGHARILMAEVGGEPMRRAYAEIILVTHLRTFNKLVRTVHLDLQYQWRAKTAAMVARAWVKWLLMLRCFSALWGWFISLWMWTCLPFGVHTNHLRQLAELAFSSPNKLDGRKLNFVCSNVSSCLLHVTLPNGVLGFISSGDFKPLFLCEFLTDLPENWMVHSRVCILVVCNNSLYYICLLQFHVFGSLRVDF